MLINIYLIGKCLNLSIAERNLLEYLLTHMNSEYKIFLQLHALLEITSNYTRLQHFLKSFETKKLITIKYIPKLKYNRIDYIQINKLRLQSLIKSKRYEYFTALNERVNLLISKHTS